MARVKSKPAATLIVNPTAGRLSELERAEVEERLRKRFSVSACTTTARDAGIALARDAADDGHELVIAFGGDGHVNEVANGLAGTRTALGIVPGGTMNVFARALGIPLDRLQAIERLIQARERPPRRVHLGRMDDRYFTFSAGCGFDAEAAERVEEHLAIKRTFGELFFYWSAFRVLAGSYRHRNPSMVLQGPFGPVPVAMVIACNAGPYAYLAGRGVNLAPNVELDKGLDVFALRTMRIENLPSYFWRVAISGDLVHHPDAFYRSDLESFEVTSEKALHRHVDGEPVPPSTSARFSIERHVLCVSA